MAFVRPVTRLRASNSSVSGSVYREHSGSGILVPASATLDGAGTVSSTGVAQPFFEDDFEGYATGSSITGQGNGSFSWGGRHDGPYVSDDIAHSGAKSLKFEFSPINPNTGNPDHWWSEQRYNLGRNVAELWVEFYVYFPDGTEGIPNVGIYENTNPTGGASNNKFHTHWGVQLSNPSDGEAAYSQNYNTYEIWRVGSGGDGVNRLYVHQSPSRPGGDIPILNDGTRGRWVRWRQYAKFNSDYNATDSVSKCWIDDDLIETVENFYHENDSNYSLYWRFGYLMGYDNSGFEHPTAVYIDDIKFYDEDPDW